MHHVVRRGDLQLDVSAQRAISLVGSEIEIHLTPREFKILFFLAKNEECICSRSQILDAVWGDTGEVFDRTVDTHVSSLRKKLGALGNYLESVPGSGYRFSSRDKNQKLQKAS